MFNPSRDQARAFFFEVRRKALEGAVLTPLEALALGIVERHPEYHAVLDAPERYGDRDWLPEMGDTNPFLHLGLHLSVAEQLSIDQPPGIVNAWRQLQARTQDPHAAEHRIIDCLAEAVWQSQRQGRPPDGAAYLACVRAGLPVST